MRSPEGEKLAEVTQSVCPRSRTSSLPSRSQRIAVRSSDAVRMRSPAAENTAVRGLASAEGLRRGAYVLAEASEGEPVVLIVASGSELTLALEARSVLEHQGCPTRVVSMSSWHLFAKQDVAYRDEVFPPTLKARVSVEAGSTFGWERWIGAEGHAIGIDHFGASAPADVLYEKFGITVDAIVAAANAVRRGA